MIKHTQTIRRQITDELSERVFNHFVKLALKGLIEKYSILISVRISVPVNLTNLGLRHDLAFLHYGIQLVIIIFTRLKNIR